MGFISDLQFGKKYEKESSKLLNYDRIEYAPNKKFYDYDILIEKDGVTTKYEVKSDKLTHKTGNACIEYMCSGLDSGITMTKADYYMYFVIKPDESYDCYQIPVDVIKKEIIGRRSMNGGDGWKAKFYLVPINVFEKYKFFIFRPDNCK